MINIGRGLATISGFLFALFGLMYNSAQNEIDKVDLNAVRDYVTFVREQDILGLFGSYYEYSIYYNSSSINSNGTINFDMVLLDYYNNGAKAAIFGSSIVLICALGVMVSSLWFFIAGYRKD